MLYYRYQIHRNAEAIVPNTGTQRHWYTYTKEHTEPEILEHQDLAQKNAANGKLISETEQSTNTRANKC